MPYGYKLGVKIDLIKLSTRREKEGEEEVLPKNKQTNKQTNKCANSRERIDIIQREKKRLRI